MGKQTRGWSKLARMFGCRPPGRRPFPPDTDNPIDQKQIDQYWAWLNAGCPCKKEPTGLTALLVEACESSDFARLGALSQHESEWVRLGVAGNRSTPSWLHWGDGLASFGMAEDPSPWVSASVLLRHPHPPAEVVAAVQAAASERQSAGAA